jgi:hypothetical protein
MGNTAYGTSPKPATAARIYDYHLGGTHNFPADREAAQAVTARFPLVPAMARANRAFLRRSVRYLVEAGIDQFLDIGSGIPTEGNVHEVAQRLVPEARVAYVDIDPLAVADSLEILDGNDFATAVRADVRDPAAVLDHPRVRKLLDLNRPVGLLLLAVLHFVTDDDEAYDVVSRLVSALPPGSYLVVSHAARPATDATQDDIAVLQNVYKRQTGSPFEVRTRDGVARFFAGLELVEPGLVWLPEWRPEPGDPSDFAADPQECGGLAGVGKTT